ncbi:MAG: hypothetical protein WC548_03520 [Candidatus Pacearchaeota archaeon]
MTKEYTEEEVRKHFIEYVNNRINYWERESGTPDARGKLEGLACSILAGIDGESIALPKFILAPNPHIEDKDHCKQQGENYYPENHVSGIKCDISGILHEALYSSRSTGE